MTWLWVLAPAIVLLGALWLTLGMRRVVNARLEVEQGLRAADSVETGIARVRDGADRTRTLAEGVVDDGGTDTGAPAADR